MHLWKKVCCAAAIALMVAPGARADEWNKKTYLTFSGPVQIPGSTLQAGTYLFQLADPDNARHVVMVASKDGTHVYGMFITIPNDRLEPADESVVMFGESPKGAPQAVQAWWYPGDRIGEEFVYPKNQAAQIAKANHRSVLATETNPSATASETDRMAALRGSNVGRVDENGRMSSGASTTTDQSAAAATTAPANTVNGRDVSKSKTTTAETNTAKATTAPRTTAPRSSTAQTNTAVGTSGQAAANTRSQLPRTASNLSLFELLSGLSLAGAVAVRQLRRRAAAAR